MFKWPLVKIDFRSAILQTGEAKRKLYVLPPRDCSIRNIFYWLLLTATLGLVNVNAKWQENSDHFLQSIGFSQLSYMLQLFYLKKSSKLISAVMKVVVDIIIAGK